jgi:hypothetical protein
MAVSAYVARPHSPAHAARPQTTRARSARYPPAWPARPPRSQCALPTPRFGPRVPCGSRWRPNGPRSSRAADRSIRTAPKRPLQGVYLSQGCVTKLGAAFGCGLIFRR